MKPDITVTLVEMSNHHSGELAEVLEGAASEIDLLRDEKKDLRSQVSALQTERDEAKEAVKKVQRIAKAQMDRHPAALALARQSGFKGASKAYEECSDALKAEKESRAADNADLTEQILAAEYALAEEKRLHKHWKDQHSNEVRRAKILKDTTDLPLERVRAYELMGELQGQVERLQAESESLSDENSRLKEHVNDLDSLAYNNGEAYNKQYLLREAAESERDRLRNEFDAWLSSDKTVAEVLRAERDQLRAEVERLTEESFGYYRRLCEVTVERDQAAEKGAESMRERVLKVVEYDGSNHCSCIDRETCASCRTVDEILADIRALSLKESV